MIRSAIAGGIIALSGLALADASVDHAIHRSPLRHASGWWAAGTAAAVPATRPRVVFVAPPAVAPAVFRIRPD